MSAAIEKLEKAAAIFRRLSANEGNEERRRSFEWAAAEIDEIVGLLSPAHRPAFFTNEKGSAKPPSC